MKRAAMIFGFVILGMPMLCVGVLGLAMYWPRMDPITVRMGMRTRQVVSANIPLNYIHVEPAKRALLLDPGNAKAWSYACEAIDQSSTEQQRFQTCMKAALLDPTARTLQDLGDWQYGMHQPCAAEMTLYKSQQFQDAGARTSDSTDAAFWHGVAARDCGHLEAARDAFQDAIRAHDKAAQHPETESWRDTPENVKRDHDYLAATLSELHDSEGASKECRVAHPEYQHVCACHFGDVSNSAGCDGN